MTMHVLKREYKIMMNAYPLCRGISLCMQPLYLYQLGGGGGQKKAYTLGWQFNPGIERCLATFDNY